MAHAHSLPFTLRRSSEEMSVSQYTSTTETVHGLLLLDGDRLVIQWRSATKTERMGGASLSSDEEVGKVREVTVPLAGVAGAVVRRKWWQLFAGPRIVLKAADLQAFEEVAGEGGLRLGHPAEMVLKLRRGDLLAGEEFAAELELAVAQRGLEADHLDARLRRPKPDAPARLPQSGVDDEG